MICKCVACNGTGYVDPSTKKAYKDIKGLIELKYFRDGQTITTNMIWKDGSHFMSYGTVSNYLRLVMGEMVEKGKAVKVRNGLWRIKLINNICQH